MKLNKALAIILATALAWGGFATGVAAAVISTEQAAVLDGRQALIAEARAGLARAEVQAAMVQLGVDPVQAQLRVAALTDLELAQLNGQLDELPAGGILGLIGAVFVVLLILELTGVIDIFKKA